MISPGYEKRTSPTFGKLVSRYQTQLKKTRKTPAQPIVSQMFPRLHRWITRPSQLSIVVPPNH
jgi:hypothetical protein